MVAGHCMLKVLSACGLGIVFLLVSPVLRGTVMDEIDAIGHFLNAHSPLSYVLLGVAGLGGAMVWVYRAAQPRA